MAWYNDAASDVTGGLKQAGAQVGTWGPAQGGKQLLKGDTVGGLEGVGTGFSSDQLNDWGTSLGFGGNKGKQEDEAQQEAQTAQEYGTLSGYAGQMTQAGNEYAGQMGQAGNEYTNSANNAQQGYQNQINGLMSNMSDQATNAQSTYTNTVQPQMANLNAQAQKNAAGAMSLAEASDPNNPVAAGFRNFYNQQAQGVGQAGLANTGVLQAMGNKSLGNQVSTGMPVTGAQMQMLQAGNQMQAGQAYANVQKQMQDLQNQGIQQGWTQTQNAYANGQNAQTMAQNTLGNMQGMAGQNLQQQGYAGNMMGNYAQALSGSQTQQAQNLYNMKSGQAGLQNQLANQSLERLTGLTQGQAGIMQSMVSNDINSANQEQAGKMGAYGQIAGGLAGGVGKAMASEKQSS